MPMKLVLVAAASVLTVSPAFALSNSQIVKHTSGPIPYSQLTSTDRSGYNARSHKSKAAASTPAATDSSTSSTAATLGDQTSEAPAAPAPAATPDTAATPAPAANAATAPGPDVSTSPPATTGSPQ